MSPASPLVTRSGSNAHDDQRSQKFYRLQADSVTVVPWQSEKPCQFAMVLNLVRQRLDLIIKTRRRIPGSGCPLRVESDPSRYLPPSRRPPRLTSGASSVRSPP